MTAGELIARVDALRPNVYSPERKLEWLRRLDGQIRAELLLTHKSADRRGPAALARTGEGEHPEFEIPNSESSSALPERYDLQTQLLAPEPWGEALYTAGLFCQIDLHNGEIQRYNQSLSLLAAAWRGYADWLNRERMPLGVGGWKM